MDSTNQINRYLAPYQPPARSSSSATEHVTCQTRTESKDTDTQCEEANRDSMNRGTETRRSFRKPKMTKKEKLAALAKQEREVSSVPPGAQNLVSESSLSNGVPQKSANVFVTVPSKEGRTVSDASLSGKVSPNSKSMDLSVTTKQGRPASDSSLSTELSKNSEKKDLPETTKQERPVSETSAQARKKVGRSKVPPTRPSRPSLVKSKEKDQEKGQEKAEENGTENEEKSDRVKENGTEEDIYMNPTITSFCVEADESIYDNVGLPGAPSRVPTTEADATLQAAIETSNGSARPASEPREVTLTMDSASAAASTEYCTMTVTPRGSQCSDTSNFDSETRTSGTDTLGNRLSWSRDSSSGYSSGHNNDSEIEVHIKSADSEAEGSEVDSSTYCQSDSDDSYYEDWSDFDDSDREEDSVDDIDAGPRDRLYNIVNEILHTEEAYVARLHLLLTVRKKTARRFQDSLARQMFPNIDVIYELHHGTLLPQIRERIKKWNSNKRIGDVLAKFGPFLKLYTEYVKNFNTCLNLVETWQEKSPEFATICKEAQERPQTCRLQIKAHMLEPVQRVPRYELLLKEYVKSLPLDSTDRDDATKALGVVTEAAGHIENMMKFDSKVGQLMDLQKQLDGPINIVSSTRELIKEGKLQKINARTGKVVDRYAFLFNDLLLICKLQVLSLSRNTRSTSRAWSPYRVKHAMEVDGMQITEGYNLEIPFTFYVKTKQKAVELCFSSQEEKTQWQQALWQLLGTRTRSKLLRNHGSIRIRDSWFQAGRLGRRAPVWVHNTQVSMCMLCAKSFSAVRRKHHCRACGIVVCVKCSSRSAWLDYDRSKQHRVCDECFLILNDSLGRRKVVDKSFHAKIKASDLCLHAGHLSMSADNARSWKKRWFIIHEGGIIYSYKAEQDVRPITSMCCSGFIADIVSVDVKETKAIVLEKDEKRYYFRDEDGSRLNGWLEAFNQAIQDAHVTRFLRDSND